MTERKGGRKAKNTGLDIARNIEALNENQKKVFRGFRDNNLILQGYPGTGKSFLALYCALRAVEDGDYDSVILVRSAVAGRDMGFLPGTAEEKMAAYEEPYMHIVSKLYHRDDAYEILKLKRVLHFRSTSNNRGLTFDNAVVIVDEAQNLSDQELHTIITRLGENCRLIVSGDIHQDDLTNERFKEVSGLARCLKILSSIPGFVSVNFGIDDIVRSDFVRDYIIARYQQDHGDNTVTSFVEKIRSKKVGTVQDIPALHGSKSPLHDEVV